MANKHDDLLMKNPPERVSTFDDGIHNARISRATLDIGDRGILIGDIAFDFGGSAQAFGGVMLQSKDGPSVFCGAFIAGVMHAVGVDEWSQLKGAPCRVYRDGGWVRAVGHLTDHKWFSPSEFATRMKESQ